jgi:hypothetical protein
MDEKGIQLRIGQCTLVLVDWDQKTVQQVEDGNHKLVTVIETVCVDGSFLPPSVIYKGKRRDLEWRRNNPCNTRCVSVELPSFTLTHTYVAFLSLQMVGHIKSLA